MKKIVSFFGEESPVFVELNNKAKEYALSKGIEYKWSVQKPYNLEEVIAELNNADAGLIDVEPYGENVFGSLNDRCKLMIRFGVGYDKVDLKAASKHGICCARTTGSNKTGVAEMALTQILALRRQLMINRKTVASGIWEKNIGNELISGKVGILGLGNIGIELAKLLQGFNCELYAYDVYKNEEVAKKLGITYTSLEEIFETCDAISVHLPYNEETHNLIDKTYLEKMKKTAVIVCTARGNIINEDDLYDILAEKRIGGAGLDVYSTEPYPKEGKLIELDNIVLTPHVSSQTVESLWYTYKKAIDIMDDFYNGRELGKGDLLNPDFKKG